MMITFYIYLNLKDASMDISNNIIKIYIKIICRFIKSIEKREMQTLVFSKTLRQYLEFVKC